MTRKKLTQIKKTLISLSLLSITFIIGYKIGLVQATQPSQKQLSSNIITSDSGFKLDRFISSQRNVDFNLFWDVWDKLKKQYIDKDKLDETEMMYRAIKGMVSTTKDPYTVFLTPEENKRAKDDLSGFFEGVGIQIGFKDFQGTNRLTVISPLENNPAIKAGVKAGDVILKIDGEDTSEITLPEAVKKIRGEKGTVVTLALLSKGDTEPHDIPITRGVINVSSVEQTWTSSKPAIANADTSKSTPTSKPEQQDVAHLRITKFGEQTTTEWNKKVREILSRKTPVKGIVLDLRGNPGGFFQGAIEIGSDLVESGVIVQQETADGQRTEFRANGSARLVKIPLVVLVDQGSASAAEILAGALRELRGVKLVGQKTFGKGSVQEALDLKNNAGLHITIYRWLLPSGTSIDKNGIEVDVKVENDPKKEGDEQLQAAIKLLQQKY